MFCIASTMELTASVCLEVDKTYSYVIPETYLYSNDINKLIDALNDTGYSFNEVKVAD